jgi:parallel beta-helix repeat protein
MFFLDAKKIAVGLTGVASIAALVYGFPASAAEVRAGAPNSRVCDQTLSSHGGTLDQLVDRLRPGQAGCLRGTFEENVVIDRGGTPGRPITLRSAPRARASLVGTLDLGPSANDVVIAGLRLVGRGAASPQVNGDRVVFKGNEITNGHRGICLLLGAEFESGSALLARNVVIDHNRIHDCGRLPATGHDHGIYVEGADGVRITNNVIYDNADYAIHLYPDAKRTYIARNVMDGNGGGVVFAGEKAGGEYRQEHASANNVVRNNVISDSREYYNIESWWGGPTGTKNLARRNCLWSGADGNISEQVGFRARGNVIARPAFRNRGHGDFRLKPRTVCAKILAGR